MTPRRPTFRFYRLCWALRRPVLRIWRLRVDSPGRIPAAGPCLIVSNHESYIDPWILGASLPRVPIRFLINEPWYGRSRLWRRVFEGYGAIPAVWGDAGKTLSRVRAALAAGDAVGLFPEGKISRDGRLLPFQPGVAVLAAVSGAPVVPCCVAGTREAAPWPRRLPRMRPLRVAVGEPLRFPSSPLVEPSAASVLEFTDAIVASVASLHDALSSHG